MFKLLLIFLISFKAYGENAVLICLGSEETSLHANKEVGPLYKLNQYLIGELAAANQIIIKKEYIDKICQDPEFSPSVSFLRSILIKGKDLYVFKGDIFEKALQESTIESFVDSIPEVFFQYISSFQKLTPYPNCLTKNVRNLDYFQTRFRYLGEEEGGQIFEQEKEKLIDLFEDLKRLDSIYKKCDQLALKKKQKV